MINADEEVASVLPVNSQIWIAILSYQLAYFHYQEIGAQVQNFQVFWFLINSGCRLYDFRFMVFRDFRQSKAFYLGLSFRAIGWVPSCFSPDLFP